MSGTSSAPDKYTVESINRDARNREKLYARLSCFQTENPDLLGFWISGKVELVVKAKSETDENVSYIKQEIQSILVSLDMMHLDINIVISEGIEMSNGIQPMESWDIDFYSRMFP
jgi:hypothetical protein